MCVRAQEKNKTGIATRWQQHSIVVNLGRKLLAAAEHGTVFDVLHNPLLFAMPQKDKQTLTTIIKQRKNIFNHKLPRRSLGVNSHTQEPRKQFGFAGKNACFQLAGLTALIIPSFIHFNTVIPIATLLVAMPTLLITSWQSHFFWIPVSSLCESV